MKNKLVPVKKAGSLDFPLLLLGSAAIHAQQIWQKH
jgi:hypothetical protein